MGTCSSARSPPLKSFDLSQDRESTCYIWLFRHNGVDDDAKAFYQGAYGKNHLAPIGLVRGQTEMVKCKSMPRE